MVNVSGTYPFQLLIDLDSNLSIFNLIKNGIVITDSHSKILYVNPMVTEITGYSKDELLNENPGKLHSGRHNKKFYEKMWLSINKKGFWQGEIWNRKKTGEVYPQLSTITRIYSNNDADDFYYIAVFSDITFLKKDIEKKLHLAFYDPLTELPNRQFYMNHLHELIHSKSNISPIQTFNLFYMDLDKFKQVNDSYGHLIGDKLLKLVGKRLKSQIKEHDIVARLGGDEFSIILKSVPDKTSAQSFARRLVSHIEEPFQINGFIINISISIGISSFPSDAGEIESLMAKADKAMYQAKQNKTKVELSA